ncbi:MAG: hypothetical protein Q4B52_03700 [Tissierellia bacterium]|nr:hypothetical protein [Tissierellia bacterium]
MKEKKITLKMLNELIKELDYEERKKLYYLLKGAKLAKNEGGDKQNDQEFKDLR